MERVQSAARFTRVEGEERGGRNTSEDERIPGVALVLCLSLYRKQAM
jgi:hypothetical protein